MVPIRRRVNRTKRSTRRMQNFYGKKRERERREGENKAKDIFEEIITENFLM